MRRWGVALLVAACVASLGHVALAAEDLVVINLPESGASLTIQLWPSFGAFQVHGDANGERVTLQSVRPRDLRALADALAGGAEASSGAVISGTGWRLWHTPSGERVLLMAAGTEGWPTVGAFIIPEGQTDEILGAIQEALDRLWSMM